MKVVLDTNVLCQDYFLKSLQISLLLENKRLINAELYIPQVVIDETINRFREDLLDATDKAIKANRGLQKLLGGENEIEVDIGQSVESMSKNLFSQIRANEIQIIPYPTISHAEIVARDLERRKPFKRDSSGYRDTLIWQNIKDLYGLGTSELVFVSNNPKDFGHGPKFDSALESEVSLPKKLKLFKTLKEFNSSYLMAQLDIVSKAEGELVQTNLDKFDLKSWLTNEFLKHILYQDYNYPLAGFPDSVGSAYITKIASYKSVNIGEVRVLESNNLLVRINTEIIAECSANTNYEDYKASSEVREFFGDDEEDDHFVNMSTFFTQSVEMNFDIIVDSNTLKVQSSEQTYIASEYGEEDWGTFYT